MFIQHLFSALVPGPKIVLATPAPAPQLWMFFMFRLSVRSTKKLFILNKAVFRIRIVLQVKSGIYNLFIFVFFIYLLKQAQGRVLVILFSLDLSNNANEKIKIFSKRVFDEVF